MNEKPDFDLIDFLPYLLNQAAEECSLAFRETYKERYGMTRTEWRVLFHLGRYGVMTANDISVRSKTHKTKISRAVQRLAERRFLVRKTDAEDRRREPLALTAAGFDAFEDLKTAAETYNRELTDSLTDNEAKILVSALRRMSNLQAIVNHRLAHHLKAGSPLSDNTVAELVTARPALYLL